MYSSNDTKKIRQIQDYLLPLQKSDSGYDLGILLLQQQSYSCKYFGALTITVFINTHLKKLQEVSAWNPIMDQLIGFIHQLLPDVNKSLFIIKKILSNILLLYMNFYQNIDLDGLVNKLNNSTADNFILITFYTILVEDLSKKDISPDLHSIIHQVFNKNICQLYIDRKNGSPDSLQLLHCMNSWFIYISIAEHNSPEIYTFQQVEPLIDFLISQFRINHDLIVDQMEVLLQSFQVLTEILETCPKFLNPIKPVLTAFLFDSSLFGVYFINNICFHPVYSQEFAEEIECFINLLIAYLNNNMMYISRNLLNQDIENLLIIILKLSASDGNPIVDEKASEQFLIFWEEFLNFYVDDDQILKESLKERYPDFIQVRNKLLTRLSSIYWKKCQFFQGAPKQEFSHYRTQVADLFLVLYQLLNAELYSLFTQSVAHQLQNHDEQSERNIEASLYLLYKITDDLTFYDDESTEKLIPYIEHMFDHNLISSFQKLTNGNSQIDVTLLNLLSSIHFYFKKEPGSKRLAETFNFLFSIILESSTTTNVNQKNLSLVASKTVLKICQDSQETLISFLPNLQVILNEMIRNVEVDCLIRERMTNAFISIAQSMKNPSSLGNIIFELMQSIISASQILIENSSSLVANRETYTDEEMKEKLMDYAISLVSCINEIGKASQLPEDVDDYLSPSQAAEINDYWKKDPLAVKSLILNCISHFSLNFGAENTLVTEKCCCILKNGLCEAINGPFKFDIKTILEYLITKINRSLQSLPYVHKLVETIIITNSKEITPYIMEEIIRNLFLDNKQTFSEDVDVVKSSLDLFNTTIETSPGLLIQLPIFQSDILSFALDALRHHEPFVTKSVTKFWITIISMRKGTFENQQIFKEIMVGNHGQFGQQLTECLTLAFTTNHRSNLDLFYPIFRNLIAKFPMQFKIWFKHVLLTKCLKQGRFEENEVDGLIARLMITRGQRQANEVLKKFWLQINGLRDY